MDTVQVAAPSTVRKWFEKISSAVGVEVAKSTAKEAALGLRQVGEGYMVGGILGAVDGTVGLDHGGVPVDFAGSVLFLGGAIGLAGEEYSHDLRNAAQSCGTIFAFRKVKELVQLKSGGSAKVSGDDDVPDIGDDPGEEDPIVRMAKQL